MATLSYWIDDLERATIPIGFVGENNYRRVIINCKKVFDKYPSLIPTLTVTPPKGDPYPAVVTRDEDNVCWDIQNSDLVCRGNGELQLSFVEYEDGGPVEDGIVGKTYVAKTRIERSILPVGEAPDPITNWLVQASAALGAIPQTILDALAAAKASGEFDGEDGVGIQRIEKTSTSGLVDTYTVTLTDGSTYAYTVTNGKDGEPGRPGDPGATGVGIRSIEKTGTSGLVDTYTITYTDNSTSTFTVTNGAKGEPGTPGQDGVSPTVTVEDITGGHRVTITDKNGSRTFDVMNGTKGDKGDPGDPTELIDDTNPSAITKTFSANKVSEMNSSLLNALSKSKENTNIAISLHPVGDLFWYNGTLHIATSAIAVGDTIVDTGSGANCKDTTISEALIKDIQVNGTSILQNGVANVPIASNSATGHGVSAVWEQQGIGIASNGRLQLSSLSKNELRNGVTNKAVTSINQHISVFYALSKLAGVDLASGSDTVGVYPDAAKVAIQKMLGIYQAPWELIREDTVTNATEANIEITVDGNGQAFELTDVRMAFESPQQETEFKKADYGRISLQYGSSSQSYFLYIGAYTQTAGAQKRFSFIQMEQRDGMIVKTQCQNAASGNLAVPLQTIAQMGGLFEIPSGIRIFSKIIITAVTGTIHYKLYGKRKWTA